MKDSIFQQILQSRVNEFQLKWKTYLLLYYAIPQYTGSDLRRRKCFILSPIFKTSFPYSSFLKDATAFAFPCSCWSKFADWIQTKSCHHGDIEFASFSHWDCSTYCGRIDNMKSLSPPLSAQMLELVLFLVFAGLLKGNSPCPGNLPWIIFQSPVLLFSHWKHLYDSHQLLGVWDSPRLLPSCYTFLLSVDSNRSLIEW